MKIRKAIALLLAAGALYAETPPPYEVYYSYTGEGEPRRLNSPIYHNKAYGYTLTIPPRYHGAILNNLNSWGMLLSPGYSHQKDATEALGIQGFKLKKPFLETCRFIRDEDMKRYRRKNVIHCDRLLRYEESNESCLYQCEGRENVPEKGRVPYRLKIRLVRQGDTALQMSFQYPARLEQLYSEMERQMLESLRWDSGDRSGASVVHTSTPPAQMSEHLSPPASSTTTERKGVRSYDNPRYGIHLPLPPGIFKEPIPYQQGGVIYPLAGSRGGLMIIVEPERVSLRTIYEKMRSAVAKNYQISYERFFGDWFVLSGRDRTGTILYEKGFMKNGVLGLYMLFYPEDQRWRLDPVIEELNRHFGPTRTHKRAKRRRPRRRLSGLQCDAAARGCYADCADDDSGCLERCEARRDRCYDTGRF